ncbi:hypothetical protein ES703_66500 [subsurface metagenome]
MAGIIFGQKYQMICGIADVAFLFVESAPGGDVCLDTNNRLDVCGGCTYVELDRAEHIAVVGNSHGVHLQLFAVFEQSVKDYSPIEKRILTVQMKMRKSFICHKLSCSEITG